MLDAVRDTVKKRFCHFSWSTLKETVEYTCRIYTEISKPYKWNGSETFEKYYHVIMTLQFDNEAARSVSLPTVRVKDAGFFPLSKQWAAVTTQYGARMEPPHVTGPRDVLLSNSTCHGQDPGCALVPSTILEPRSFFPSDERHLKVKSCRCTKHKILTDNWKCPVREIYIQANHGKLRQEDRWTGGSRGIWILDELNLCSSYNNAGCFVFKSVLYDF